MGAVRVEVIGVGRIARALRDAAQALPRLLSDDLRTDLGPRLADTVYPAAAPRRSGRLAAAITADVRGQTLEVISPVRDPESGFPYTGVTRFGHVVKFIYPRRGKALRFESDGRTVFATRVRGYQPDGDWAEKALPAADHEVSEAGDRIARDVGGIV